MWRPETSRLGRRHPAEKAVLCGGFLLVILLVPPYPWAIAIGVLLAAFALLFARIPFRAWSGFLAAPVVFLCMSSIGLLVTLGSDWRLHWAPEGPRLAGLLLLRSIAAVCALALFSLTTPLADTLAFLRRVGIPQELLDLAALVFRFLFVAVKTLEEMRTAQSWRMGRSGWREHLRVASMLASSLFVRCLSRARRLEAGLEARGYSGNLHILRVHEPASPTVIAGILALQTTLLIAIRLFDSGGAWKLH